ncbi:hypothetical protein RBH26_09250 [Natronolimnohabitans sp. A-GB9]|uniref:hypothetical protein n=1 Tax=Natronolimnohabitans sp. A-GB9 TaxID=3069757 RepID=UPI0027B760F0|nr:hypothetical protein [Natronolimnohabitans sp. A-GB9]MDQ2050674.1 hypothetical protein [Natronolimnohabitans sp. A-GB9]
MAPSQLQHAVARLDEELHFSWTIVAVIVGAIAVTLLLEGTASVGEIVRLVGYTAAVVALAVDRIRQWSGIWFLWALLCVHFALLFSAVGGGLATFLLLLAAGTLAALGVQDLRGELEL